MRVRSAQGTAAQQRGRGACFRTPGPTTTALTHKGGMPAAESGKGLASYIPASKPLSCPGLLVNKPTGNIILCQDAIPLMQQNQSDHFLQAAFFTFQLGQKSQGAERVGLGDRHRNPIQEPGPNRTDVADPVQSQPVWKTPRGCFMGVEVTKMMQVSAESCPTKRPPHGSRPG